MYGRRKTGPIMTVCNPSHIQVPQSANLSATITKRNRRTHPKVRTGCITCKIRRKKCDETKPDCRRCTSTGRKCDGYAGANDNYVVVSDDSGLSGTETFTSVGDLTSGASSYGSRSSPGITTDYSHVSSSTLSTHTCCNKCQRKKFELEPPTISLGPGLNSFSSAHTLTDLELHCFSYFRYHTGPQLAAYFASTLWQDYSIRIALHHPVIFACAAAVGAVHRRFNLGISAEALQWCSHSDRLVCNAKRLLSKLERDVRGWHDLQRSSPHTEYQGLRLGSSGYGIDDNDILMTAYMLLFNFESFQTDFPAAVDNLKSGMRYLFSRPMRLLHREMSYPSVQHKSQVFVMFFEKVKSRARELLGSEDRMLKPTGNSSHGQLPLVPVKFDSLRQARDYIFTEVHQILHTSDQVWDSKAFRTSARMMHMNRILGWSSAYAETVRHMDMTESEKRVGNLLRVSRSLAYTLLYIVLRLTSHISVHTKGSQDYSKRTDLSAEDGAANTFESDHRLHRDIQPGKEEVYRDEVSQSSTYTFATSQIWKTASQREDLMLNFYRLEIWANMLLDPTNSFRHIEHSVTFDSGVGPPLGSLPSPQSSGKTRFIVKYVNDKPEQIVENTNIPEHLGIYGIAEQSSAIEEHAVLEVVKSRFPAGTKLEWVDVTLFAEARRILLQYCCGDPKGLERSMWVQEWWMF